MEGPPVPPAVRTPPPEDETPRERERRLTAWLAVVSVIAVLAAGAAGYAISEIESTKDENRQDDQAVGALRSDLDALRTQFDARIDRAEDRLDDTADAQGQRRLRRDLDALDGRVGELDREDGGGQNLRSRIDDLEQRLEDLEQDEN